MKMTLTVTKIEKLNNFRKSLGEEEQFLEEPEFLIFAAMKDQMEILEICLDDLHLDPSFADNAALIAACENASIDIIKRLLKDPRVNPSDQSNEAVYTALFSEENEVVKLLIDDPRFDPIDNIDGMMEGIAITNNVDMFKYLIQGPHSSKLNDIINDNDLYKEIFTYGRIEMLEILFDDPRFIPTNATLWYISMCENAEYLIEKILKCPEVDPSKNYLHNDNYIIEATECGSLENVKVFLKDSRINPSIQRNKAFESAMLNNEMEIMELLLHDHRFIPSNNMTLMLLEIYEKITDIFEMEVEMVDAYVKIIYILLEYSIIYSDNNIKKEFKDCLIEMKKRRELVTELINYYNIPNDLLYEFGRYLHHSREYYKLYLVFSNKIVSEK